MDEKKPGTHQRNMKKQESKIRSNCIKEDGYKIEGE